jgi:PAS domain S-box-containing protein
MTYASILIVENDRIVARDLQQQLVRMGHTANGVTARGEDVLALTAKTAPELVLMDICLEGSIDAVDAARMIRERRRIPVVFLTPHADDDTLRRAGRSKPYGYLIKPINESELRTVIEVALHQHATERKLGGSERRFANILSSVSDAVIAVDGGGRVTLMNPVAERLTGWSQEEAVGTALAHILHIIDEETRERVEVPATRTPQPGVAHDSIGHNVLLARDGREISVDDRTSPIIDDNGNVTGAVLVLRDVTARHTVERALRRARERLVRVTQMNTLGEFAISIAHELNQPLMAIVANGDACLGWLSNERRDIEEARKAAERIVRNVHRAGDVIRGIRALAGKPTLEMAEFDLDEAIREVLGLLHDQLRGHRVAIEIDLHANLEPILGDRAHLQQVVMNLVINSMEAIEAGGHAERIVRVSSRRADGEFAVAIEDTGPGLNTETAERIFEAFYTTKSQGAGLGLSICRSIIEAHAGRLWASAREPYGCIFQFSLPAATRRISSGHDA